MRPIPLAALIVATLAAAPLQAATIDGAAAQAIVTGCVAHATGRRQSHAIVVVDTGGHLVAALRMDGNGSGIFDFALAKAQAVAAWGFSTANMIEAARQTPGFAFAPNVVMVGGGVPIYAADGSERIGAVGVSGEAQADDIACAEAGIAAAGLRTAPQR